MIRGDTHTHNNINKYNFIYTINGCSDYIHIRLHLTDEAVSEAAKTDHEVILFTIVQLSYLLSGKKNET